MFNKSIVKVVQKSEVISEKLESITFNSIRKILPNHAILNACRQEEYDYRCRLMTPIVIVLHMITAAIWPEESFNAAWQLTWSSFSASFPQIAGQSPSRAGVSKARKRLPLTVWQRLTHWISQQTQQHSTSMDKWRGHRIVLADGTCLTLPDEPELRKNFPPPRGKLSLLPRPRVSTGPRVSRAGAFCVVVFSRRGRPSPPPDPGFGRVGERTGAGSGS